VMSEGGVKLLHHFHLRDVTSQREHPYFVSHPRGHES
jgi:hypothetical protein